MINATLDVDYSDLGHGKWDSPMAKFIDYQLIGNGDFGEDEWSNGMGDGFTRFGRRIYAWDDRGFIYCDTYDTVGDAVEKVRTAMVAIEAQQDEMCSEQGCSPCPVCASFECGACDTSESSESGSTHVVGCDRDWIG